MTVLTARFACRLPPASEAEQTECNGGKATRGGKGEHSRLGSAGEKKMKIIMTCAKGDGLRAVGWFRTARSRPEEEREEEEVGARLDAHMHALLHGWGVRGGGEKMAVVGAGAGHGGKLPVVGLVCRIEGGGRGADGGDMTVRFAASLGDAETQVPLPSEEGTTLKAKIWPGLSYLALTVLYVPYSGPECGLDCVICATFARRGAPRG